jgi:sugar phosphate isomerase/epimerase
MEISICSYSFHRLLAAGKQDMFQYISDCKTLGATQLDPWNAHLAPAVSSEALQVGSDPLDRDYLHRVKRAAEEAELPFGCIAVDGAHIYEPTHEAREANRKLAYAWLDVAEQLGASQIRIDAGGPEDMPDDVFDIIVKGYQDLVTRGREKGIEITMENHWGPSIHPVNVSKIMEAVNGLGLLFDTHNWAPEAREKGWEMCAKYATAVHIKTFEFDETGLEPSVDIPKAMHILIDAGYDGCWGIESVPHDGDEYAGVRNTIALIEKVLN